MELSGFKMNTESAQPAKNMMIDVKAGIYCHPECLICSKCRGIIACGASFTFLNPIDFVCESCSKPSYRHSVSVPEFGEKRDPAKNADLLESFLRVLRLSESELFNHCKQAEKQSARRHARSVSLPRLTKPPESRLSDIHRRFSDHSTPSKPYRAFLLGEIEVLEELGQGFYGVAKKVRIRSNGRLMVMKEVRELNDASKKTFRKEIQILRRIEHPNVLRFVGVVFQKQDKLSFIVEYASGGSLRSVIHDFEREIPWHTRVSYAKDIAEGMAYLHSLNVIHRDLNSHNCLVKDDGKVVVADFGLSYVLIDETHVGVRKRKGNLKHLLSRTETQHEDFSDDVKQRLNIVGSPFWMAPEMLKNKPYDHRVDIFSYGIVLCELIGRVDADPDYLPRTSDFGLNVKMFKQNLCSAQCPNNFVKLAVSCCQIEPITRPSFVEIVPRLTGLEILLKAKFNNG